MAARHQRNQSLPSVSGHPAKRGTGHVGLILPFRPSESPANLSLSSSKDTPAKPDDQPPAQDLDHALPDDLDPGDDQERRAMRERLGHLVKGCDEYERRIQTLRHNIEHRLQAWNSRRKDIEDLDREAESLRVKADSALSRISTTNEPMIAEQQTRARASRRHFDTYAAGAKRIRTTITEHQRDIASVAKALGSAERRQLDWTRFRRRLAPFLNSFIAASTLIIATAIAIIYGR